MVLHSMYGLMFRGNSGLLKNVFFFFQKTGDLSLLVFIIYSVCYIKKKQSHKMRVLEVLKFMTLVNFLTQIL